MQPLVSILIPAYNAERWLAQTLQSALAQTWLRHEVIVVDDGSRDQTLAVARRFESAKVRVVHQANAGASAARNHAFKLAQGDYIQWLDADDVLDRHKIERQLQAAALHADPGALFTAAWGRFFNDPTRARLQPGPLWQSLTPSAWLIQKFQHNTFMMLDAWLVPRAVAQAAGPWDEQLSFDDDGEYACRLVAHSTQVVFVGNAHCGYRSGNNASLSWQASAEAEASPRIQASAFQAIHQSIQQLQRLDDSPAARQACVQLVQDTYPLFYEHNLQLRQQCEALAQALGGQLHAPSEPVGLRALRRTLGRPGAQTVRHWWHQSRMTALRWRERLGPVPAAQRPHPSINAAVPTVRAD
jgi:hypothetical protein